MVSSLGVGAAGAEPVARRSISIFYSFQRRKCVLRFGQYELQGSSSEDELSHTPAPRSRIGVAVERPPEGGAAPAHSRFSARDRPVVALCNNQVTMQSRKSDI